MHRPRCILAIYTMLKRGIWSCVPSVRFSSAFSPARTLATVGNAGSESELREDLAAAYRVTANYGWSPDLIYNHISVRCGGTDDDPHFLLNPYGLGYEEVTASSLVKVDGKGSVVDPGSGTGVVNAAGFVVHSAIHLARPDLHAVMHTHEKDAAAVSAMECGLLPLTQDAMVFGEVRRHQYAAGAPRSPNPCFDSPTVLRPGMRASPLTTGSVHGWQAT